MRVLTGDETGLVKVWDVQKSQIDIKMGEQAIENSIQQILFYNDNDEERVVSCSQNTTVNMYQMNYEEKKQTLLSCIQLIDDQDDVPLQNKLVVKSLYKLRNSSKMLYTLNNNQTFTLDFDQEEGNFSDIVKVYAPENQKDVERTSLNQEQNKLLVLSKGVNPQVIDINEKKQIWKARNVRNDWLDLQVPIWDVDGCFYNNDNNIYTVTAYQKIRAYDLLKKNSQPIIDFDIDRKKINENSPFTCMKKSHCQNYLFVANKLGSVFKFDTRKNFQLVGKCKGSNGSIRDIALHPTLPYIGTVSLDRFVRVFNESEKLVGKQNMSQKLNTLLFSKADLEDQEEFEEEANLTLQNQTYKKDKKSHDEIRATKDQFKNMKKHTIKLDYLKAKQGQKKTTGFLEENGDEDIHERMERQQQKRVQKLIKQNNNDNDELFDYQNEGFDANKYDNEEEDENDWEDDSQEIEENDDDDENMEKSDENDDDDNMENEEDISDSGSVNDIDDEEEEDDLSDDDKDEEVVEEKQNKKQQQQNKNNNNNDIKNKNSKQQKNQKQQQKQQLKSSRNAGNKRKIINKKIRKSK